MRISDWSSDVCSSDLYPDDWIESGPSGLRLRSNRRHAAARELTVDAAGTIRSSGRRAWFLPGKFKFCPACRHQPAGQAREVNKLAALSAEGRRPATTLLVSSVMRWMNRTEERRGGKECGRTC